MTETETPNTLVRWVRQQVSDSRDVDTAHWSSILTSLNRLAGVAFSISSLFCFRGSTL